MEDRQRIFQMLVDEAKKHGVVPVRDAANQFLKLGLRAVVDAQVRRPIPRRWVVNALVKQKGICIRCREPLLLQDATGDHTIALAQGGVHSQTNITAMHRTCNSSKGSSDLMREAKRSGNLMNEMFPSIIVADDTEFEEID